MKWQRQLVRDSGLYGSRRVPDAYETFNRRQLKNETIPEDFLQLNTIFLYVLGSPYNRFQLS